MAQRFLVKNGWGALSLNNPTNVTEPTQLAFKIASDSTIRVITGIQASFGTNATGTPIAYDLFQFRVVVIKQLAVAPSTTDTFILSQYGAQYEGQAPTAYPTGGTSDKAATSILIKAPDPIFEMQCEGNKFAQHYFPASFPADPHSSLRAEPGEDLYILMSEIIAWNAAGATVAPLLLLRLNVQGINFPVSSDLSGQRYPLKDRSK